MFLQPFKISIPIDTGIIIEIGIFPVFMYLWLDTGLSYKTSR